jgi:lipoate-protein ligase A
MGRVGARAVSGAYSARGAGIALSDVNAAGVAIPEAIDSASADVLMRRDAIALEAAAADGIFRAHIYRFARPSVTAGRNARVTENDLARWGELRHDFARRPTGGGVIRHEDDISFGVVFPGADAFATDHLRTVSTAIGTALREQGIETTCRGAAGGVGAAEAGTAPGRCFQAAVGAERLYHGEKLVGLAARRARAATLIQGSMTVRRHPERDLAVLGLGPRVDLAQTDFDANRFAGRIRALLEESL